MADIDELPAAEYYYLLTGLSTQSIYVQTLVAILKNAPAATLPDVTRSPAPKLTEDQYLSGLRRHRGKVVDLREGEL